MLKLHESPEREGRRFLAYGCGGKIRGNLQGIDKGINPGGNHPYRVRPFRTEAGKSPFIPYYGMGGNHNWGLLHCRHRWLSIDAPSTPKTILQVEEHRGYEPFAGRFNTATSAEHPRTRARHVPPHNHATTAEAKQPALMGRNLPTARNGGASRDPSGCSAPCVCSSILFSGTTKQCKDRPRPTQNAHSFSDEEGFIWGISLPPSLRLP